MCPFPKFGPASSWLAVLSIFVLNNNNEPVTGTTPPPIPPPPTIWFSEISEEDSWYAIPARPEWSEIENLSLDNRLSKYGTDYVITNPDMVMFIVFGCRADYPVDWTVPNMSELGIFRAQRISSLQLRDSHFTPELDQPSTSSFKSFLVVTLSGWNPSLSAGFTCIPISPEAHPSPFPKSNSSSLHLFIQGNEGLEREGQNITLPFNPAWKLPLILPCRPFHPFAVSVTLQKQMDGDGSLWKNISDTDEVTFNPKIGFTMDIKSSPFGIYRCFVNSAPDNDTALMINVTLSNDSLPSLSSVQFRPYRNLTNGASIKWGKGAISDEIFCCSGVPNQVPLLREESCEGHLQCEIKKSVPFPLIQSRLGQGPNGGEQYTYKEIQSLSEYGCDKVIITGNPTLVQCHGRNVNFSGEYLALINPNRGANSKAITIFKEIAEAAHAPLDERMMLIVGHSTKLDKQTSHSTLFSGKDNSNSIFVLASNKEYGQEEISEYPDDFYQAGEPLRIMCFGLRYFYSDGACLRINWRNGSNTILEREPVEQQWLVQFRENANLRRNSMSGEYELVSLFGREVEASVEMKSVDCFIPFRDSARWDVLGYQIHVAEAEPTDSGYESGAGSFMMAGSLLCYMAMVLGQSSTILLEFGEELN